MPYNTLEKRTAYQRKYRDAHRESLNEWRRNRYYRLQRERQADKVELGCSVCGYDRCAAALHYHHLGGKNFGIAASWTKAADKLREEIDACVLLCANCHAELHAREVPEETD